MVFTMLTYKNPTRVVVHDPNGISLGKRVHYNSSISLKNKTAIYLVSLLIGTTYALTSPNIYGTLYITLACIMFGHMTCYGEPEYSHTDYGSQPIVAPQETVYKIEFNNCAGELNLGGILIKAHGIVLCDIPVKKLVYHHITIDDIKPIDTEKEFNVDVYFNDNVIEGDVYDSKIIIGENTHVVRVANGMIGLAQ